MAEVNVKIKAQNQTRTGFQQALGDAQRFGTSASGSLKSAFAGVASDIKSSIGGALAGLASIGAIKSIIDQFGRISDLSEQFGVSAESLQRFGQLASESGSSMEQLAAAFARLTINIQKAQGGTGAQADALRELGLSASELANLSPEEAFLRLADALQQAGGSNSSYAAALDLIGNRQRDLIPLLAQGADAVRAQADAIDVASADVVTKVDEIGDRFGRLGQQIAVGLGPAVALIGQVFLTAFAIVEAGVQKVASTITSLFAAAGQAMSGDLAAAAATVRQEFEATTSGANDLQKKIDSIWGDAPEKKGKGAVAAMEGAEESASASSASQKAEGVEQQIRDQITANARANMTDEERLLSMKREKLALENKWGGMSRENELKRLQLVGQIDQLEKQIADKKTQRGPEFGPGTAEAATGGFRVDAATFQQQQAEEAARAIMAQQQSAFQGSQGASAFQRIGFATNEFFDTRQKKSDPGEETKRAAKLVNDILQILKKGEPLVLANSNT